MEYLPTVPVHCYYVHNTYLLLVQWCPVISAMLVLYIVTYEVGCLVQCSVFPRHVWCFVHPLFMPKTDGQFQCAGWTDCYLSHVHASYQAKFTLPSVDRQFVHGSKEGWTLWTRINCHLGWTEHWKNIRHQMSLVHNKHGRNNGASKSHYLNHTHDKY